MEADTKDVCTIQDEDVLRRMWQQTEDFSRKKEIRAHMYKLREARLKEFYTSGEVLKDVQRSNSSPGLRDQHAKNPQWTEGPTHADSLADHSFLSLKSKEIRDSESPTREVQYRNSKNRSDDGAWTITANVEKSEDGKTLKSSRIATTQGSRPLDGGELAYAAKNEQHSSVYSDGDANNFTKRVGESSKTHAQQQVTIGDDKNYHTSKSTSSSSSSKIVSHHTSTSGNTDDFNPNLNETSINRNIMNKSFNNQKQIGDGTTTTRTIYTSEIPVSKTQIRDSSRIITSNDGASTDIRNVYSSQIPVSTTEERTSSTKTIYNSEIPVSKTQPRDGSTTITSNVYSSDIPDDLKKNIMDGNTKVITETKTLPDGSTVTTTRYETKGSKKWSSTSGSSQVVSNRQVVEQRSSSTTDNKQIEYGDNNKGHHTVTVTKTIRDDRPNQDYPDNISKIESTRIIQSERNVDDRINKKHLAQENIYDHTVQEDIRRENVTKQDKVTNKQDIRDDHRSNETVKVTKTIQRNDQREDYLQPKPVPGSDDIHTIVTTKTTVHSGVSDGQHVNRSEVIKKHESVDQTTRADETYPREREPVVSQPQERQPQAKTPQDVSPPRQEYKPKEQEQPCSQDFEPTKSCKPPTDPYKASSPTSDQYSTTYRQEFTNKRISVDISPTHNAFASSLRAVSPDRASDRNKSRTSLRNSSSSLRSSTSPDKNTRHQPETQKHPTRMTPESKPNDRSSPERKRVGSPRKDYSPERYNQSPKKSPDFAKSQSPERRSPDRKPSKETIIRTTVTKTVNGRQVVDSGTLTKKKPDDRKSPEKNVNTDTITRKTKTTYDYSPVRTPSPTKPGDCTTPTTETVTTKITKTTASPERPSSIRATSPIKSADRNNPVRSPTKTPDTTFNSDTITRKKKVTENDKPIDRSSPVGSPTKPTEVIITTKDGTITKKKTPTEESPRDRSPTKPLERESPIRSRPTEVQDKNKSRKPSSRDSSPTCSTSDIEFISTIVTDLDEPFDHSPEKRPTSLDITAITTEKTTDITDKSVTSPKHSSPVKESPKSRTKTSPVKDIVGKPKTSPVKETPNKPKTSPVKEVPKRNSFQPSAPELESPSERPPSKFPVEEEPFDVVCEVPLDKAPKEKPPLKRTETYEDHCRKMLGLTSETPLVDEYAGKEPVEEPLIVKTHHDYGCREDELIHSHVHKITKHRPEVEPTVDSTDFIKTEKYETEAIPENKKSPTKELASPVKPQAKTPTQKTSTPERKTPEKLTVDRKSPEKLSPGKKTSETVNPEKRIPIKVTPEIKSEKISPEKKKPKKQEPDEGEYITEYTDEYCERSKRPTDEKKPKQVPTLITGVTDRTTIKKPTRESPSPDRKKKPLHEQPQKKEPVTGDYSTEYTDEYGEVSPQDRDSPRHTIDRKISKENVTSILSKTKKMDKKPVRDSPDKKREKSPKKHPSKVDDSDSDEEYIVECTMDVITTQPKQKPVDKFSETITVDTTTVTTDNTLYPKQPQRVIEDETREMRTKHTDEIVTKSVLKKPKDTEPMRHSPNKPTIITDLTDEYCITDRVVSNSHTTNTNTFINQEKYDTDITLIQSPRDTPEREPKRRNESLGKPIPKLEDEHPQEPHIRTHRVDTTVVSETEGRAVSPRRQPLKAIPSDTMECTFTTTMTTNVDEDVYPIRRPTKSDDKPKTRKPEDRKSPIKQIKDEKKDTKITTSKVITKKSLSTEIDTKRRIPTETPKRKAPTEKAPKEKSPVRQECPRQRSPSPHKITTKRVLETDRVTTQVIRKTSNKDLTIKKTEIKGKIIEQPKRLPAESPIRKPLFTSPASSDRKPATKPKATEPVKKHVVTKTISLVGPKPQPLTPGKTSPKTIAVIKTKVSPTTITKTTKTTKTAKKTIKHDMYTSDSDSEPEYIVTDDANVTTRDVKKRVVTTATIKMTSPVTRKEPSPSRIRPDVTSPSFKRSTSSREQSPEKMCPVPVSSEDESGFPRYPDQINEPDDSPLRRRPVTDIPLTEDEDVKDFHRITEVARKPVTRISDIDKVHETDESLLSVTEKVSRFITSAEKTIDNDKLRNPAPKIPRPELMVSEDLEDDECLLSVSDKVTKFISTAEQVSVKKDRPVTPVVKKSDRSHSPVLKQTHIETDIDENDECLRSVTEKVTHFIQAADTVKQKPSKEPASKVARPEFTNIDETLRTDECLLSVSDKVTKFLTTAEKVATEVKTIKSEPKESIPQRQPSPEKNKPDKIRQSPVRQSPVKRTPEPKVSPTREAVTQEPTRPKLEPITHESTRPKSEPMKLTETKTLKSSEAVRKAKALFENITKPQPENTKQRDILSRPSVWEGRKKSTPKPTIDEPDVKLTDIGVYKIKEPSTTPEVRKKLTYTSDDEEETSKRITKDITLKSTKLILSDNKKVIKTSSTERQDIHRPKTVSPERELSGYLKPVTKSNSTTREEVTVDSITQRTRHLSPEQEIPGYMRPISKTSPETRTRSPYSHEREPITKSVIEHEDFDIETKYVHKTKYENGDVPGYMRPLQRYHSPEREYSCRKPKDDEEIIVETTLPRNKHTSPDRDVPGYMRPLQRHAHSPDRESDRRDSTGKSMPLTDEDVPRASKKFGVVLRRTDSGRVITTTTTTMTERRRSSVPGLPNVEEIQDLDVLEKMLDKVVGYEQRRRIRAQIRIVKRLISENKIQYTANSVDKKKLTTTKHSVPVREPHQDRKSPSKEIKRPTSPVKNTENKHSTYENEEHTSSSYTRNETTRERSMSPDVKKKSLTTTSIYKTDLKPAQPPAKVVNENQPSWVTNRNLKKTETVVTNERKMVPMKKKETPRRSPSPQKETRPIDCITSSYGIGPTDENGQPLFGIRALRKAAATDKVQVRGTVVTSQFYSENGQEPVGEVTVTKYSNNPKELNVDDEQISSKAKGFASVTTTQKFGSRGTPSLKNIVDKKKTITDKHIDEDEIFKTTSTKVTRRGSVKALSQKFIENAVEISRNERQTYPKAGLILRTSSFKDSASDDKSSSRESSPGFQGKISLESITSDSHKTTTTSTTTSHREHQQMTDETKTFLNSHTRVANAQDVITRMKNAEREEQDGDTAEDREARMLLNKFLGAQVLMSGMEPLLKTQSGGSSNAAHQLVRKVQKTKTVTSSTKDSSSKPITLSKRFQCPITPEVLEDIWDEQTLRLLLEQCTDYEERRVIRARLRQVMAEQEAVANVVASAVADRDTDADRTGSLQGESLLLPLLQELLDKKSVHQQQQQQSGLMNRSASSQSSEESATATIDSGTESGEDLRLLAVGLCDSMDSTRSAGCVEPLGPGLLAEVQNALSRLAVSLQLDSPDVQMETDRKQQLIQLVARLQANLVVTTKPPAERRLSNGQGRFSKNKNRQNRHTVGVSTEEIAAARKLMEEVVLRDSLSSSVTPDYTPIQPDFSLEKQHSDEHVANQVNYRTVNFSPQISTTVKNATPKPFNPSVESTQPFGFKSVSEPTTPHDTVIYRDKPNHGGYRQSLSLEGNSVGYIKTTEPVRPMSECIQMDYNPGNLDPWNLQHTQKTNNHIFQYPKAPDYNYKDQVESETDDDSSTVKQSEDADDLRHSPELTPTHMHYVTDVNTNRTITPVNEHVHFVREQPEYSPPKEDIYSKDLSSAQRLLNIAINDDSKGPANRFNKKMKMKRANTIDIPKPLNYYEANDESDDSLDDRDDQLSTRRSNYLALRGPIRVSTGAKSTVPSFEPKTENDKKFMAFIQKHNNNTNVTSLWQNKPAEVKKKVTGDHNWSRKFGNIKTIFEKEEDKSRPSSTSVTSAKQFWQSADDSIHAGKRSYNGPKINKQGTRQLQSIFEQKQKEPKLPWTTTEHNNIVTGNLKIESNFKPIQNNQLIQGKNYKFIPQPLPVNKFSHAPMSAFKPPPKRTPVQNAVQTHSYPMKQTLVKEENGKTSEPGTPLFLYTPKHLEFPQPVEHEEESKPPSSVPWIAGPGKSEHRVLQLAASKFENSSSREVSPTPTRKTSKDKVHIPLTLQNNGIDTYNQKQPYHSPDYNNKDLSSPFLVKNLQPSKQTVRKLSGEYDNNKMQQPLYKANGETHIQPIHTVKQTVQKFTAPSDVAFNNNHNESNGYKQYPQPPRKISDEFDHIYNNKEENSIPYKPQRSRKVSGDYDYNNHKMENDQFLDQQEILQPVPKQMYQYTGEHQPQISQQTYLQYPQQEDSTKNSYQCELDDLPKQTYQYPQETGQNKSKQIYQYPEETKESYQYPQEKSAILKLDTPKQSYRYSEDTQPKQSYQYPQDNQLAPKIPYEYQPESRSPIPRIDTAPKQSYQYPEDIKQSTQYSQESQLAPRQPYQHQQESRSPIPKMDTAPKQSYKYPEDTQPRQSIQSSLVQKQPYQYLPESKSPLPVKIDTQPKQMYQYPEDTQSKNQLTPQTYQYSQESKSPIPKQETKANKPILKLDFSSSGSSTTTATPDTLNSPAISSPMTEYTSVTRVMTGPVSQQAITVQQNTPKNRDEHDMARNLHNVLKKMNLTEDSEDKSQRSSIKPTLSPKPSLSYKSPTPQRKIVSPERKDSLSSHIKTEPDNKIYNSSKTSTAQSYSGQHTKQYEPEPTRSKPAVSPNYDSRNYSSQNRHYESDRPTRMINTKPITTECLEINDEGESVVTTKLQIPVSGNVYYNNTSNAPRSRNLADIQNARTPPPPPSVTLTKSDSWHKLAEPATSAKPSPRASPRASPNARNLLQKAKSSHSLAVPKQFEAGLNREEVEHKKNSVAAYFGGGQPLLKTSSSSNLNRIEDSYRSSSQQTSINRNNTMNKISAQTRTSGLSRSRTMPDVVDMFEDSLDVDAEFENIFRASIAK